MNISKRKFKILIALYFVVMVLIAFMRFPDVRNELKYFIVTDEMINNKNWFILTYFNDLYPDKPPLYFWILSLIKIATNSYFYPVALIITGIIPFYLIGYIWFKMIKKYYNRETAYIFLPIFLTLPYLVGVSLVLRMDTLMGLFITLVLYFFMNFYTDEREITPLNLLIFYMSIAVAILIKGGAGIAVSTITIIFFLSIKRELKFLQKIYFLYGTIFILAILGIWLYKISKCKFGMEYINLLIGQETFGRMVKAKSHIRPFYYYLLNLSLTTLPLMPFFFIELWRKLKKIREIGNWELMDRLTFSLFLPNLIFFSLLSGKLDIYLFPLYGGIVFIGVRGFQSLKGEASNIAFKTIFSLNNIVLIMAILGINYYNSNYTLKKIIPIMKTNKNSVYSYKFSDVSNISCLIRTRKIEPVENIENLPEGVLVLTKEKYFKEILKGKLVYKNKFYAVFKR